MKFTLLRNALSQVGLGSAQVTNQMFDVPDDTQKWLAIMITVAQAFLAIAAHFRTPGGNKVPASADGPLAK